MVEPSSALRSCTAEKRTSVRPHLGHVCLVVASVFTSCRLTVWTEDSFWRRSEGKSEGFDLVIMVFEAVSKRFSSVESPSLSSQRQYWFHSPRFSAPQHSHCRMFFELPLDEGSRLPQSVQKTRDPMAAILQLATPLKSYVIPPELSNIKSH